MINDIMIQCQNTIAVYLYRHTVDFRKQINGLSQLVQEELELDVFAEACFVFINRGRDRIKILYWQNNGFCLWLKRLEQHKFAWPNHLDTDVVKINKSELQWLLDGFDIWVQPPHQTLKFTDI